MTRKIKKKEHENHSLQRQVSHSANFDLRPFWREYLKLEKSIWCKLNFFRFLTQISAAKELIWERYEFSKTTHKFCQQTGFKKKQVQLTSKASKPTWKLFIRMEKGLYLGNLTSLSPKPKLEDFMQDYFFFLFRKIVIVLLKCRLFILKKTIFIF